VQAANRERHKERLDLFTGRFLDDERSQEAGVEIQHQRLSSRISRKSSALDFRQQAVLKLQ